METLIQLVVLLVLLAIGYLLGAFLAFYVLVAITVVCVVVTVWMAVTLQEMASLLTLGFGFCATIVNLAMWVTYYITTNQSWVGEFFLRNVLR